MKHLTTFKQLRVSNKETPTFFCTILMLLFHRISQQRRSSSPGFKILNIQEEFELNSYAHERAHLTKKGESQLGSISWFKKNSILLKHSSIESETPSRSLLMSV
ncbi:hypothetical protein BpHYR1_043015 [Brachionus plicatilis]|uniref:Uncharacterized protein n=1 Tax=Brachionus plicatilis TaxID=10195 RepID=A0A3M7QL65_BRAPC|nr:hypothetical protein BpHYR1_043015 [Brachionus plicatilis]